MRAVDAEGQVLARSLVSIPRGESTGSATMGVTGCSFGAYHALTMALRHPDVFTSCITMGGAFDIAQFLDGYFDEDCYFLNPPSFLPGLTDPYYLDQFRRNKWVLVTGDQDICRAPNEQFSALLHAKGIHHSLHVWNNFAVIPKHINIRKSNTFHPS